MFSKILVESSVYLIYSWRDESSAVMHPGKPVINGYINTLLLKVFVKLVLICIYLNPLIKTKKKINTTVLTEYSTIVVFFFFRNGEIYPVWEKCNESVIPLLLM